MTVLMRIAIVLGLIYILMKVFARNLGSGFRTAGRKKRNTTGRGTREYDHLTDQKIEDADFEELNTEDER